MHETGSGKASAAVEVKLGLLHERCLRQSFDIAGHVKVIDILHSGC